MFMHSAWGQRNATLKCILVDRNSKTGQTNVIDTEHLGRPSATTTDEKQEARAIILAQKKSNNRRNTV